LNANAFTANAATKSVLFDPNMQTQTIPAVGKVFPVLAEDHKHDNTSTADKVLNQLRNFIKLCVPRYLRKKAS
jgi:hypothetical protein